MNASAGNLLLTIDIGNTRTHFAFFRTSEPEAVFSIPTQKISDEFLFRKAIEKTIVMAGIQISQVRAVVASVVVPAAFEELHKQLKQLSFPEVIRIHATCDCGIHFYYDDPSQLGADRVCASTAAYFLYGGPVIAIDAGTAVTFDCINAQGEFIGGAIMPGLSTIASALHQRTAQLPEIQPVPPVRFPAQNTVESLQAGLWFGWIDGIRGMIRRLTEAFGSAKFVVTGGDAEKIIHAVDQPVAHERWLVFKGLRIIAQRMNLISDKTMTGCDRE